MGTRLKTFIGLIVYWLFVLRAPSMHLTFFMPSTTNQPSSSRNSPFRPTYDTIVRILLPLPHARCFIEYSVA